MSSTESASTEKRSGSRGGIFLLLAQMILVGGVLAMSGRFLPRVIPDTPLYSEYPVYSLREALENHRTPVYPLFLKLTGRWFPDFQAVPATQYVLYCLAVLLFFRGLTTLQANGIRNALIAGALLYSNLLFQLANEIGADCLAATGLIAVFALMLIWTSGRTRAGELTMLGAAVFFTWLTRPAYLFLILLVPVLSSLCRVPAGTPLPRLPGWRIQRRLIAGMLLPLFAYCSLQWFVVGRFAVVSLGGYNLIGISGQFLDEATLEQLPAHLQPLGREALKQQQRMDGKLAMPEAHRLNYQRMLTR